MPSATHDPIAASIAASIADVLMPQVRAAVAEELVARVEHSSPWLTVSAAGAYLGISEDALRALIQRKEIRFYKPNGRLFIDRKDLDTWIRGGE